MSQLIAVNILLLTLGILIVSGSLVCPSSLQHTQYLKSYGDVCLYLITIKLSWNNANSNCRRNQGHLVQIRDQGMQDFIYSTLKSMNWRDSAVWIGATRHGTWTWTDGSRLSYAHWQPGLGSVRGFIFSQSGTKDCAVMRLDDSGKWQDYNCGSALYHTSICEYQKVNRITTHTPKITTTLPTTAMTTVTTSTTSLTTTKKSCSSFQPAASLVKFYKNFCLGFVKGDKSWIEANADCIRQGGMLVQIHSQQDQDFIFESLKSLHWSDSGAWIGATDRDSEGHWEWSNGSPVIYSHWNTGEGQQHSATNENCAMVNVDDGMWYDYACDDVIYNQAYICQY